MKKSFTILILVLFTVGLARCGHHRNTVTSHAPHTLTVTQHHLQQSLHFTGIIQPQQETALTAPIEAIIETMPFHYGQLVNQGDVILTLNSSELEKQYNDTLTDYLKAKDNYNITKVRFNGTQQLWDDGLISKNNYVSEQSSVNTAHIALLQSTQKLNALFKQMDNQNPLDVTTLDMTQFEKVQQALNAHHNHIDLKAPTNGILLYPPKTSGDEQNNHPGIGATIKAGQVIALIGDMNGIHIDIDIPETDINKIQQGMSARVTGTALGKYILTGKVIRVNTQAIPGGMGKSPSFSATVEVTQLSDEERKSIKIGMSAAIELIFEEDKQLLIPIKAIHQINGQRVVTIQRPNGATETREVVTGPAEADRVVIERGLKPGEVIVYDV